MLRLSRKTLFAIEAVLDIAYHAGAGPVRSAEITRRQGIPSAISSARCRNWFAPAF